MEGRWLWGIDMEGLIASFLGAWRATLGGAACEDGDIECEKMERLLEPWDIDWKQLFLDTW